MEDLKDFILVLNDMVGKLNKQIPIILQVRDIIIFK